MKNKSHKQIHNTMKPFVSFRLLALLLCFISASMSATISAQQSKITLKLKNVELSEVLNQIESKTGYSFLVRNNDVNLKEIVSIDVVNKSVEEVLTQLFKQSKIKFNITGKSISIYIPQESPNNSKEKQTNKKIYGIVTDQKGEPIIGAAVFVKGTKLRTVTDVNGKFSIDASDQSILTITYMGYETTETPVTAQKMMSITLKEDSKTIEEVVVVGYGTQKKVNLTGAVSSITSEKLSVVPTANVSTLLYGNLPGLIPIQRSGEPGLDDVSLSIRGFSGALVVVDGVAGRDFSRLDPNEIESVTILKDAASSAVYGVSGGNGVILVTTKKGKIGKPILNFTMNYGVQHVTKYPRFVNSEEFAILKNEASVNLGGKPVYTQEEVQKFKDGTDPNYPNFDYYDYMVNDYPSQKQQNISVRGGSEKIKYFFLLGQTSQASMWKGANQDYAKYNFRSNVDASISDNLDVSIEFGGNVEDRNNIPQNSYEMSSWMQYSWPICNPKTPDGKIASTNYGLTAYLDRDLSGYIKDQRNVYQGAISLNYKIPFIKGLSAKFRATRDMSYRDQKQWLKKFNVYAWDAATQTSTVFGSRGKDELKLYNWKQSVSTIQSSLTYERTFANVHNVKALLLYEVSENQGINTYASRTAYIVPIDQLFAGPTLNQTNDGGASDGGREGYVGRVNYDYSGKYLFEYSFRYDGSAKFAPDHRWGYFSGISAGWRISEENFIKDNFTSIDNLKLRGSWGELGSDNTGNYQYLTGYTYPSGNYVFGGNTVSNGVADLATPNPNITWEQSQIFDLGVDISLWNRLLEINADVFYRKRDGLLATRLTQLPSTFGATLPAENLNSDDARGFEISLGHSSNIGELKYRLSTNLSYSRLKRRHIEQRTFNNQYDNWRNNGEDRWNNVYWGYKAIGQFQSMEDIFSSPIQDGKGNTTLRPGDIKYDDYSKDGMIGGSDIQVIGRGSTPELNYGLGINANWKKITVDMNWQGAANFNMMQSNYLIYPFENNKSSFALFMDRWHRADPTDPTSAWIPGKMPSTQNYGAPNNKNFTSSFWLKDATYLRLKSLSISYNLESAFLKRNGVQGLAVSLSGQNLLTFSGLGPTDPEAPSGGNFYYPQQKTYNIGISLTF